MKLALELEFPDDQAANVLRLFQNTPNVTARILTHPALTNTATSRELALEQQIQLLHEVFGSWKLDESGEEIARRIYVDRQYSPRDIESSEKPLSLEPVR